MVKEKRIVFEIEDVVKVRIQCGACGDEVVKRVNDESLGLPQFCPLCNERWRMDNDDATHRLLTVLPRFANRCDGQAVTVSFEMDETDD